MGLDKYLQSYCLVVVPHRVSRYVLSFFFNRCTGSISPTDLSNDKIVSMSNNTNQPARFNKYGSTWFINGVQLPATPTTCSNGYLYPISGLLWFDSATHLKTIAQVLVASSNYVFNAVSQLTNASMIGSGKNFAPFFCGISIVKNCLGDRKTF